MALDEVFNKPWTRKHDNPAAPKFPSVPRTVYPKGLEDLVEICSKRQPNERLHAAGSHWALSAAAISDHTFIETHDPNNVHQAMDKTLFDVIPECMNDQFIQALAQRTIKPFDANTVSENEGLYPVHFETGKRIYQAYAELDAGDTDSRSLANVLDKKFGNSSYLGPWAFPTLGGAGGQTVFGALHTGTHGGDIHMPPIADSVMALHLVADGGKHFWIEPASSLFGIKATLTDTLKLNAFYGQKKFGGSENFQVLRNNDLFHAVLVSAGRFGVVYSVVIATVRQYSMHQERRLTTWKAIKEQVKDPSSALYTQMSDPNQSPNKFLQIAINVTPQNNFTQNLVAVQKRRNVPMAVIPGTNEPAGRPERGGQLAGNSHPYEPDPANPGKAKPPNFLEIACTNASFVAGVLTEVAQEIKDFVSSNGATIGITLAAVAASGAGGLLALLGPLLAILALLAALIAAIEADAAPRLGNVLDQLRSKLLDDPDPVRRQAGLLVWQMIASKLFSQQQANSDFEAISYAVMDGHDYFDKSCNVNVQSVEVFFDATDPMLIAFVDALLAFEVGQEANFGHAFVGYISLRFTGPTRALLGQQKFPVTCSVEVAGLADVVGTTELVDHAVTLALDNTFKGILHWGQRNDSNKAQIDARFGPATDPLSPLARWREALKSITNNGQLNGFSSAFTQKTRLEEA